MIDITNSELFKDLTSLNYENQIIDLHNEYECLCFKYISSSESLEFVFESRDSEILKIYFIIIFEQVEIEVANFYFKRTESSSTINIFYRGRFELNGKLFEFDSLGKKYWYLEFETGDKLEIFSSKVFIKSGIGLSIDSKE